MSNWKLLKRPIYFVISAGFPFFQAVQAGEWRADSHLRITDMAFYKGELVVSGVRNETAFGRLDQESGKVALWNGRLKEIGTASGFSSTGNVDNSVNALLVEGDLIAAGRFNEIGGVPARHIAKWDGNAWRPFSAVPLPADAEVVTALAVFGGYLVAAYQTAQPTALTAKNGMTRLVEWTGSEWREIGMIQGGYVAQLAAYVRHGEIAGQLICAGKMREIRRDPASEPVSVNGIAAWNGIGWNSLGPTGNDPVIVNAVAVADGSLFAGGLFRSIGDEEDIHHIARWDGNRWNAMAFGTNGEVRTISLIGRHLVVGGSFTEMGGIFAGKGRTITLSKALPAEHIGIWDLRSQGWQTLAPFWWQPSIFQFQSVSKILAGEDRITILDDTASKIVSLESLDE